MFSTRIRRTVGAFVASLFVAGALAAPAQAVTFNVSTSGTFDDPFAIPAQTDVVGSLSGSFEAADTSGNGFIESNEITAFSLSTSGFTDPSRNFTISDATGSASVFNGVATNEIATGISAGLIDFVSNDFELFIQIDLQLALPNFAVSFSYLSDPTFALLRNEDFTINGKTFPGPDGAVPLPAGLPLLLGGLGLFGILGRRRKA